MKEITVYKIETQDTCRGLGTPAATVQPHESDEWDMVWVTPVQYLVPDDFAVAECVDCTLQLYDGDGEHLSLCYKEDGSLWAINLQTQMRLDRAV